MSLFRLPGWLRPERGPVLARWRVDADLWRAFVASERQRPSGSPANELPTPDEIPAGGIEVTVEPEALWLAGQRVSLPLRGTPEILGAQLLDPGAGAPTVMELSLKYPAYATPSDVLRPSTYSRLSVPVPGLHAREARIVVAHFNRDTPGKTDFFHGPGDGSDPEDLSKCWSCGFETHKFRSECERCGASLQSRRWSRRFGVVLMVCGVILTGLMGAVLFHTAPMLLPAGVPAGGGIRFNGTVGQAALALLLMSAVLVFGATALAYGAWQLSTGKRSLRVVGFLVTLFSAMLAIAFGLQACT